MTDPIGRFTQVNSIKSQTANDEAMDGADKQKELIDQKKQLRDVESHFETATGTGAPATAAGPSAPIQDLKRIQSGIAEAKDSFELKKDAPLYTADPTKGQLSFGDGIEGKIPPSGDSNIKAGYLTGQGQSGNIVPADSQRPNYFSGKSLTAGDLAQEQEYIRDKRNLESNTGSTPVTSKWNDFVETEAANGGSVDPNALVQHVLRESYLQTTEDLRFYADKVKYFNECKQLVREHLNELRNYDAALKLDTLAPGKGANVIEDLSSVLRESVQDNNEDKQYYLGLLQKMNKISSEISNQLESISDASNRLTKKEKDDDD